jgi:hypothetical protein
MAEENPNSSGFAREIRHHAKISDLKKRQRLHDYIRQVSARKL